MVAAVGCSGEGDFGGASGCVAAGVACAGGFCEAVSCSFCPSSGFLGGTVGFVPGFIQSAVFNGG